MSRCEMPSLALTTAYHDAYVSAAMHDGYVSGIAHVGDAWSLAWSQGVTNPDLYGGSAPGRLISATNRAANPQQKTTPRMPVIIIRVSMGPT